MDNLIITAELVNPPSDVLAFRTLTMFSSTRFHLNNLIEVEQDYKDVYYSFMRAKGIFDYISDIVTPTELEIGIRLDLEPNYPLTIIADRIDFLNLNALIGQLILLSKIR